MSLLQSETKEVQSRMAMYCRTGEQVDLPGVAPNRLHHYRRLVYNIIQDNLESSYPIAFKYLKKEIWQEIVKSFFSQHPCQSYQVWQIPGEFYDYCLKSNMAGNYQLPFLNDLLRFEWEEMVIYNMEDKKFSDFKKEGDPLSDFIIINPEFQLLPLQYPVHLFNPLLANDKKGQYYVLLYRDLVTGSVKFMDVSVWFALVVEQLSKAEITLKELIQEAPKLFGNVNVEELTRTTLTFVKDLTNKGFVLGYK